VVRRELQQAFRIEDATGQAHARRGPADRANIAQLPELLARKGEE
jgi:hypothetical protein